MQIETYEEIEETVSDDELMQAAAEGEVSLLVEQLGLEGQQSLFSEKKEAGGKRNPYRPITKEENFVFETLFPNKTEVEKFKDGPIPLRVLQIVAFVRSLDLPEMAYIGVMHPDKFVDDPVLFAQSTYYSGTRFLLARWGKALLPFDELREMAIKKKTESSALAFKKIIREATQALENIEDYVREEISSGKDAVPTFYL